MSTHPEVIESTALALPAGQSADVPVAATDTSPAGLLRAAIQHGIDAQGIKILAEVFERMQAKQAEREFNAALSAFQAECPVILKNKEIEFPTKSGGAFRSRYAEMDSIIDDTRELRRKYEFSHSFDREVTEKQIKVTCILRHSGGHQTSTPFAVPIPKDNKLSEAHAVAGAVTFCERYAFRGALGITTGMPDNDGKEFTKGNPHGEQPLTTRPRPEEKPQGKGTQPPQATGATITVKDWQEIKGLVQKAALKLEDFFEFLQQVYHVTHSSQIHTADVADITENLRQGVVAQWIKDELHRPS